MARNTTKRNRSALACAKRDLKGILHRHTQKILDQKNVISKTKKAINAQKRSLVEYEQKLEKLLENRETAITTIEKYAETVKIKIGQAIHHKKYGNCLVRNLRLTKTGKTIQAELTGVDGGWHTVPHAQCIPFEDMTTAIFGS